LAFFSAVVGAFRVESEKAVSSASEMRVKTGCASERAIACRARRPASQVGNMYAMTSRRSGRRCTWMVTSVMMPRRPSEPMIISRTLGPVEVDGRSRRATTPDGRASRSPFTMSAMSPYLSDCMPDDRVATQPPSVE